MATAYSAADLVISRAGAGSISEFCLLQKPVILVPSPNVSEDHNGVEEYSPMEEQGWKRRLLTAKSFSISLNGKRDVGDEGNDYVASLYFVTGNAASTKFEWTMIDETKVEFNCIVNCTGAGGDSTAIDALEFEVLSDGKPTVTPATTEE